MTETTQRPDSSSPNRPHRFPLGQVLGTLLSLVLLVYLVIQGWEEFARVLQQVSLSNFALALGFMLVSRLCVTLRWFALLRTAGAPVSFGQTMRLTFMGLFASNFLPSTVGGDFVRLAGAVVQRVEPGVSAASLVVDRLVGMAGMALLAPVGLAAVLQGSALAQGLAGAFVSRLPSLGEKLAGFARSAARSSTYWLRHPAGLVLALLFTLGHMLCTFLAVLLLLRGMGQHLSLATVGGLWSLSYFITLIPVSVNGLGLQEVSITYLYTHFGGVSMEAALALAVFMRLLFLAASLPGAVFLPAILNRPSLPDQFPETE